MTTDTTTRETCEQCRFSRFAYNGEEVKVFRCHESPPIPESELHSIADLSPSIVRGWVLPLVRGDSFCSRYQAKPGAV